MLEEDRLREDFGALFRATYGELCGFVLHYVGSRAIAEELVQDVFVRLWDRRASWQEELPSRTYLYRSARNRALDHIKHERVVQRVAREYPPRDDERLAPAADAELDAPDLTAALDVAIQQLPPRTRQVFVLSRGHGLTYAQIAEAMEISVKTVEAQMSRAFRILRDRLRGYL